MTSFVESIPSQTLHHNGRPDHPLNCLASHCLGLALGDSVAKVFDALAAASEGGLSLPQLLVQLRRRAAVTTAVLRPLTKRQRLRDAAHARAALLVLWQHSVVNIRIPSSHHGQKVSPIYTAVPQRALYLGGPRYAKALELVKKAVDETAAVVVETLLTRGKARTVDLIRYTIHDHFSTDDSNPTENGDDDAGLPKQSKHTPREAVVHALVKLIQGGFLENVKPLERPTEEDEFEDEFQFGQPPPAKRVKIEEPSKTDSTLLDEDPALNAILERNAHYKAMLPPNTVWRVHWKMIHASLRAVALGRLVNEVHGHRVQSAGSYLSAALRYRAAVRHGPAAQAAENINTASSTGALFAPDDIAKFLPKPVYQNLEKKTGGVTVNLHKALMAMCKITATPRVVRRAGEDLFEVCQNDLLEYWKKRVIHQLVSDRHGAIAARILTILLEKGWLEADTLAQFTMVPVKDTRAILHTLYESGYVDIFPLYTSGAAKQQNPNNAIYLWKVETPRLRSVVIDQIALATLNLRLRRQHQVEIGKTFIERAQQETDENENETDKVNYQKFSLGLERLDVALQQLDETLMVLGDF